MYSNGRAAPVLPTPPSTFVPFGGSMAGWRRSGSIHACMPIAASVNAAAATASPLRCGAVKLLPIEFLKLLMTSAPDSSAAALDLTPIEGEDGQDHQNAGVEQGVDAV